MQYAAPLMERTLIGPHIGINELEGFSTKWDSPAFEMLVFGLDKDVALVLR